MNVLHSVRFISFVHWKMVQSKRGIFHLENISIFLAELFGTALLVFLSCSSCIKWNPNGQLDGLQICLSCGFAVLISVQIFGCVSGAHINPCVTLGAAIYNIISVQVNYSISFQWKSDVSRVMCIKIKTVIYFCNGNEKCNLYLLQNWNAGPILSVQPWILDTCCIISHSDFSLTETIMKICH